MSNQTLDSIHPTIFIGLGGAGGQVLGRLSELFRASYGQQANEVGASPLQFMLLDTDDYEKLPLNVRQGIPNPERDFVSLSHFNPHKYVERQLAYPDSDLHRWLDKGALRFLEDAVIHDGASRLRTLGRLSLHYRYSDVEQRLREKMDAALSADVHADAARIRPDARPLRIYIVTSSCGGTGSGTFLDVAAMVNRVARDRGTTPDVQGFVFLPFPFIELNARLDPALEAFYQHNAWAFFDELNFLLKHPRQIPEYVLDPGRKYGQPPRPFEYGKDLLRTIFLLGNRVSTLGTLTLDQLYDYSAHGVFHVFLTPEEGTVQSRFSNIKVKLQETDRRFGLVKRFASFGYAEYRFSTDLKRRQIARRAADLDWHHALLGQNQDRTKVDHAAAAIEGALDAALRSLESAVQQWMPKLQQAQVIVDGADSAGALQSRVLALPSAVDTQLGAAQSSLVPPATVRSAVLGAIIGGLNSRHDEIPLGVKGEELVIEAVIRRLATRAAPTKAATPPSALAADAKLLADTSNLANASSSVFSRLPLRGDRQRPSAAKSYTKRLNDLINTLTAAARSRLEAVLQEHVTQSLSELLTPNGELEQRKKVMATAISMLSQRPTWEARSSLATDLREAPTIQHVPSRREVDAAVGHEGPKFFEEHTNALKAGREGAWKRHRSALEAGRADAVHALADSIDAMWLDHAHSSIPLQSPLEQLDTWASQTLAGECGIEGGDGEAGNPLRRLAPLATPPCPLDRTLLAQEDSVPVVVVAIGPDSHKKEIEDGLRAGDGCGWSTSPSGSRIAVLQTWYAFSSRALEGMETLRRSYLDRDRSLSLPHIERRWNEHGLQERVDSTSHLTSEDVHFLARALALSHFFQRPGVNGSMAPGLYICRDERDVEPSYLVRYHAADGTTELRWRTILRVPDRRGSWEFTRDLHVHTSGSARASDSRRSAPRSSADPARDFAAYLVSEEREDHAAFLVEVKSVERSGQWRAEYRDAYRGYAEEIDRRIAEYSADGFERHLPFLQRISDELHRYVRELEPETSVLPDRGLKPAAALELADVRPMETTIP